MIYLSDEQEVLSCIRDAATKGSRISVHGGGTLSPIGRPVRDDALPVSLSALSGVVDYDPAELVLTVRPGTALAEIETLLSSAGQMLAFDPFDAAAIFDQPPGRATIGGIVAGGISGARRVSAGAVRDHLLGLRAVSGRGETFVAGAKVVKNVTGYDLPKLASGSWGRLFVLTEVTLKVLPRPQSSRTLVLIGQAPHEAVETMAIGMGSQADVAACAYDPGETIDGAGAMTAFRLEGFGPSVEARTTMLRALLAGRGDLEQLGEGEASAFWNERRSLSKLPRSLPLYRVNLPPSRALTFLQAIQAPSSCWLMDWAGGLIWLCHDESAATVRKAVEASGGHAMLFRAGAAAEQEPIATFHPQPAPLAALEERVRRAFDPQSVFETGRF